MKRPLKPEVHTSLHRRITTEFEFWEEDSVTGPIFILTVLIRMDNQYLCHREILRTPERRTIIDFISGKLSLPDAYGDLPF